MKQISPPTTLKVHSARTRCYAKRRVINYFHLKNIFSHFSPFSQNKDVSSGSTRSTVNFRRKVSCFENETFIDVAFTSPVGMSVFLTLRPNLQKDLQLRCFEPAYSIYVERKKMSKTVFTKGNAVKKNN